MAATTFVAAGLTAITTYLAEVLQAPQQYETRQGVVEMLSVATKVYESLLVDAYHGRALFTGKKDGTNRPLRYDKATQLMHVADPWGWAPGLPTRGIKTASRSF